MLVRLSMPRSPMRFFNCPMRAFTNPCRSFAYLYSAFSERSPCARATAISLGRSMLSSRSSAAISSCNFVLIFFNGSDIVFEVFELIQNAARVQARAQPSIIDACELPPQAASRSGEGARANGNYRTFTSRVCVLVFPAASAIVNVYVVSFVGVTSTHRAYEGHTGFVCGSSFTVFALATL